MTFAKGPATPGPMPRRSLLGLLVTSVGLAPWVVMATLNARIHPEMPWAALATLAWLVVYIAWLNGAGPPARWKAARRYRLRLWRPGSNGWSREGIGVTLSLMAHDRPAHLDLDPARRAGAAARPQPLSRRPPISSRSS